MRKLVAGADYEAFERKFRIEVRTGNFGFRGSLVQGSHGLTARSPGKFHLISHCADRKHQIADTVTDELGILALHPVAGLPIRNSDGERGIFQAGKRCTPQPVLVLLGTDLLLKIIADLIPVIHRIYAPIARFFHKVFHK